jgi:hypothetical protein
MIRLKLESVPIAIMSCAILHNIALQLGGQDGPDLDEPFVDEGQIAPAPPAMAENGNIRRAQIIQQHFTNIPH